ncbi:MAG: TlpA disulfide reductase family protein [Acidimicrobiales bacterium]
MSNRTAGTTRRSGRPIPPRPGTTPAQAPGSRGRIIWIGIAAVILIAAVVAIAVAASGGDDDGGATADGIETGGVEAIGDPLPTFVDPVDDPAIGSEAPLVSAATFDGDRVAIDGESGARIFGFFAHWCPVCQRELPRIVDYLDTTGLPDEVDLWAVSTGVDPSRGNYPPSAWFAAEGYDLPVLMDSSTGQLATALGLRNYPYFVVVNADNEIAFRISGELTTEQFDQLVEIAQQG